MTFVKLANECKRIDLAYEKFGATLNFNSMAVSLEGKQIGLGPVAHQAHPASRLSEQQGGDKLLPHPNPTLLA